MMKRYCRRWGVEVTFDIRFWLGCAGFGVRAGPSRGFGQCAEVYSDLEWLEPP